ncbi:hypothetical protein [Halorarum salinum]|uniref:Uncharacterized protein n=1 Tax=Halorarum salinum TaxID=2743089 RepID=A0A7D5QB08_9EURY|nr:hypothetical protein [Halobaculum salinum]QLG62817.1 hypothetical protein HUG12_14210 [Halobaculum salinum]
MPKTDTYPGRKAVAIILVTTWSLMTVAMSLEGVATVTPPFYGAFTALVFLLVGRLWNLEVEEMLPGTSGGK